jgi:hypothetical protein
LPDPSPALGLQLEAHMIPTTKSVLSPARRRLVELLQTLNFGRLERLPVRAGEPVLDPLPPITREYKFASENGPRPEATRPDCALKPQHLDLLRVLDEVRDGTIAVIICKHGIPFSCELPG